MVNQLTRPGEMPWRKVTGWILLSWTDAWFCWLLQVLILRNSPDCHYGLDHWLYFCVWWSLAWCMNWYSSTWHYHHQHGMQQRSSLYMELWVFSRSSFDANFTLRSQSLSLYPLLCVSCFSLHFGCSTHLCAEEGLTSRPYQSFKVFSETFCLNIILHRFIEVDEERVIQQLWWTATAHDPNCCSYSGNKILHFGLISCTLHDQHVCKWAKKWTLWVMRVLR